MTHAARLSRFPPVVTVAMDARSADFCVTLRGRLAGLHVECVAPSHPEAHSGGHFGDAAYNHIVWLKPNLLHVALSLGHAALVSDIDVVWRRSPTAMLANDPNEYLFEAVCEKVVRCFSRRAGSWSHRCCCCERVAVCCGCGVVADSVPSPRPTHVPR